MEGLTCRLSSFFLESWKNLEKSPEHICYPGSEWRIWAVFFSFSGMTLSLQQFFFNMVKIGQPTPCGGWKTQLSFQPLFFNGADFVLQKKQLIRYHIFQLRSWNFQPTACLKKPLQQRQPSNCVAVLASLRTPGSSRETEITKMTIDWAAHRSRVIGWTIPSYGKRLGGPL